METKQIRIKNRSTQSKSQKKEKKTKKTHTHTHTHNSTLPPYPWKCWLRITRHSQFTGQHGKRKKEIDCISSLPVPPASRTPGHWLGDYCRKLTSAHNKWPGSNWVLLVCKCKPLTTKLKYISKKQIRV